jgi:NADH-quinone oxidoreductase subunit J
MSGLFYGAGAVAVVATLLAITRASAVHALLYVVVSLLSVAAVFFSLGAPFVAALEIIVYAGAIMVLFVFVVMLLDQGPASLADERARLGPGLWRGPALLAAVLGAELAWAVWSEAAAPEASMVGPESVGRLLLGPWVLGLELAGLLLLAALVAAHHLGQSPPRQREDER